MGGQASWNDPDTGVNDYVVNPELSSKIYYKSTYKTLWGQLNGTREVRTTEITHGGNTQVIDAGNDSVIWEKDCNRNSECRFTMREENKGMATYGEADVKPGDFAQYMHSVCYVRQVDSPAYPIVGFESAKNIEPVVNDLVKVEQDNISLWRSKEVDLDGFRAIYMGASRPLLDTENGGKGITLAGGVAGMQRSCYNTYVAGQPGLTTPSVVAPQHEGNLAALLAGLGNDSAFAFTYDTHERISYLIDRLYFNGVKLFGEEYRAAALIDERNMYRMTSAGGTLARIFENATQRSMKNPALYKRKALVLDDILYIPCRQMEYFRPTTDGATITYGCGMTKDPRSKTFVNTSDITTTIVLGRGALLRGRRKGLDFTVERGPHRKGASYALHYHDGIMRREWFTKDDRTEMMNDSSLIVFNFDPGVKEDYII